MKKAGLLYVGRALVFDRTRDSCGFAARTTKEPLSRPPLGMLDSTQTTQRLWTSPPENPDRFYRRFVAI